MKNHYFISFTLFVGSLLSGCTGLPEQVTAVSPFSLEQYQGKWYEIARLDHSFERGLETSLRIMLLMMTAVSLC